VNVSDFDYELPGDLIAQVPQERRDASRLLVLDRTSGAIEHRIFSELPGLLDPGDLLVLNDARVIPARLFARKPTGGRVELLLVERIDEQERRFRALIGASRAPKPGAILLAEGGLRIEVAARSGDSYEVRLLGAGGSIEEILDAFGRMPLPPYVRRDPDDGLEPLDRERYQTVYARNPGAVAAPTAGLHFSEALLDRIRARGVRLATVTLHVGPGSFLPVRVERVEEHRMHGESYELPEETAEAIAETRGRGGRVVAVGTTVVRTLEACALPGGLVRSGTGRCDLFIYPGFRFQVVDALVTNFHLPRSTLLMLVCAFAGRERVLAAYREAIGRRYRFYSYGDAMLVRASR
jgi:S-adenosylmethionine:tRNA ribosyltransferase-isomerase